MGFNIILNIENLNQNESVLVNNLSLNIPTYINPFNEPVFYIKITGESESNQFIDLDLYSGLVSINVIGNISPGVTSEIYILLENKGENVEE